MMHSGPHCPGKTARLRSEIASEIAEEMRLPTDSYNRVYNTARKLRRSILLLSPQNCIIFLQIRKML